MKTLVLSCLATAAVLSFSACTTVETQPAPTMKTTTTTTDRTLIQQPVEGVTETRTTRTY